MSIAEFVELLSTAKFKVAPGESLAPVLTALAAKQTEIAALLALRTDVGRSQLGPHDELLIISEAAQRLGVRKDWLYKRASKLPFTVRLGRKLRFSANGIEKYIRHHQRV